MYKINLVILQKQGATSVTWHGVFFIRSTIRSEFFPSLWLPAPLLFNPILFHIPSDRFISSMKRPFLIMAPSMSVMPISLARV